MIILKLEAERENPFESKDFAWTAFAGSLGRWLLLCTLLSVLSLNDVLVGPPEL